MLNYLSNTDGRTDGLTKKVVTFRGDIPVSLPANSLKQACICIDKRETCPRNCLLRWF